jgi:proline iminopeptidase
MKKFILLGLLFGFLRVNAQEDNNLTEKKLNASGVKMVPVRNGKYKVFTQKTGSGKNKLLLLPGGPGSSFEYFEIFPLHLKDSFEIYFYSPLGCYLSDQPEDTSVQTMKGYVEDLEDVRRALGIDHFYLLGHSWGGRLALAYAAKYQTHLKGLIFSNSTGLGRGFSNFQQYQQQLYADIVEDLPSFSQYAGAIRKGNLTEQSNPKLMDSIMKKAQPIFIKTHFLRLDTIPEPLIRSRLHSREKEMGPLVRDTQNEDVLSLMNAITLPVLFLGAKYDYVPPEYEKARLLMKNATDVTIIITPNGSHRPMWDDADNYFFALRTFVNKINNDYR